MYALTHVVFVLIFLFCQIHTEDLVSKMPMSILVCLIAKEKLSTYSNSKALFQSFIARQKTFREFLDDLKKIHCLFRSF